MVLHGISWESMFFEMKPASLEMTVVCLFPPHHLVPFLLLPTSCRTFARSRRRRTAWSSIGRLLARGSMPRPISPAAVQHFAVILHRRRRRHGPHDRVARGFCQTIQITPERVMSSACKEFRSFAMMPPIAPENSMAKLRQQNRPRPTQRNGRPDRIARTFPLSVA